MKHFFIKGILCFLFIGVLSVTTVSAKEQEATLTDLSKEELGTYLDIESKAQEYGVDAEELLNKIYNDLHKEGVFSPYSNIEMEISSEEGVMTRTIPSTVYNQDSTMYLETGNPCASGKYPYIGCVAVHKTSSSDRTPLFPFGTAIHYIGVSVNIEGNSYSSFIVEDTGDGTFSRSTYWTDVYGGARTDSNTKNAINYGVKKVSFTWD